MEGLALAKRRDKKPSSENISKEEVYAKEMERKKRGNLNQWPLFTQQSRRCILLLRGRSIGKELSEEESLEESLRKLWQ